MTYKEARVYLDEMSKYGSVLGLDTIRGLLRELGNPQDSLKFIHIAGTNGKGSVLAYTSTILSEAGYRTGRYVSPTVMSYLEKIQVDTAWISESDFAQSVEQIREAIASLKAKGEPLPTLFEAETAMAFLYFQKMHCDLVVLETGLGGETDATNIVKNTICAAFATISIDHLGVIGDTLEEIAQTKSGIIKSGCAVVSARQTEVVRNVLKKKADSTGCSYVEAQPEQMEILADCYDGITFSYKEFEKMHSNLAGQCQRENLATALEIIKQLRVLGYEISDDAVRRGLEKTVWEGRFTCLRKDPVFIIDGAHNEDAAIKLRTSIERYFKGKKIQLIMGVFRDKEYEKITSILCPLAKKVYTVELPNKARSLSAEELAECAGKYCKEVEAKDSIQAAIKSAEDAAAQWQQVDCDKAASTPGHDLEEAHTAACGDGMENQVIIACGSLSYLGEVKRIVEESGELSQNCG